MKDNSKSLALIGRLATPLLMLLLILPHFGGAFPIEIAAKPALAALPSPFIFPSTSLEPYTALNNTPPVLSQVSITPQSPTINDDLVLTYLYTDIDGDPEGATRIRWRRDGHLQPRYNDALHVDALATLPGDRWCVTITPHDGQNYGQAVEACLAIEGAPQNNIPPLVLQAIITPSRPIVGFTPLTLTAILSDTDLITPNTLTATVNWRKNDQIQLTLHNRWVIPIQELTAGDIWCAEVTPFDGEQYGSTEASHCVIIHPFGNYYPTITEATITPTTPFSDAPLTLSYTYDDIEGDPEGQTTIRWYQNDTYQPAFYNRLVVSATALYPGSVWSAIIHPHDGEGYGLPYQTEPVIIQPANPAPTVENVVITPPEPGDDSNLYLTYAYNHLTDEAEGDTEITWYKNLQVQPGLVGLTRVPSSATQVGDIWYARVTPQDNSGQVGSTVAAHSVEIISSVPPTNNPPVASNVRITPGQPNENQDLVVNYSFSDLDNDPEGKTQIKWYLFEPAGNRYIEQTAIGSQTLVLDSVTTIQGDRWKIRVIPHDGKDYGTPVESDPVAIIQDPATNASPVANDVRISPTKPSSLERLVVHYIFNDADNNAEQNTQIQWYQNGVVMPQYENFTSIPPTSTNPGEEWYVTVLPHNGIDYGDMVTSPVVTINTPPTLTILPRITPEPTFDKDNLGIIFNYFDVDGDPLEGIETHWYKNDILQSDYDGFNGLPATATQADDNWFATVSPFDGIDYGPVYTSTTVSILTGPINPNQLISPAPYGLPTHPVLFMANILSSTLPAPELNCQANDVYEENDTFNQACGPLRPNISYLAYPEDVEDIYYFDLTETASVVILVQNYQAEGQLLLYDNRPGPSIIRTFGSPTMQLPPISNPAALQNVPPGRYYIRIYTASNATDLYTLTISIDPESAAGAIPVITSPVKLDLENTTLPLLDNQTGGDFQADDGLYTTYVTPTAQTDLQASLIISEGTIDVVSVEIIDDPDLIILTDWAALYREFQDTGMGQTAEETNLNSLHDFFDLMERINQYTTAHRGVVIDLPSAITQQNGYDQNYRDLAYSQDTQSRYQLGLLIDELIHNLALDTNKSFKNVVILGDDEVVPHYRVFDPTDLFELYNPNTNSYASFERNYPNQIGGTQQNPVLEDMVAGYIMSDVPYSLSTLQEINQTTWSPPLNTTLARPEPTLGIGRIFAQRPLELAQAITRYEQPLILEKGDQLNIFGGANQRGLPLNIAARINQTILPQLQPHFDTPPRYYNAQTRLWFPHQVVRSLNETSLTSLWGHSTHQTLHITSVVSLKQTDFQSGLTVNQASLLAGMGCHLGLGVGHTPGDSSIAKPYQQAILNPLLAQGITVFAPSSYAYVTESSSAPNLHELMHLQLLLLLYNSSEPTLGEVWQQLFPAYHSNEPPFIGNPADPQNSQTSNGLHLFHITGAYGNILYGLPTQPIQRLSTSAVQISQQVGPARYRKLQNTLPTTISLNIPALDIQNQADGRVQLHLPGGTHLPPANGIVLPALIRTVSLPKLSSAQVSAVKVITTHQPTTVYTDVKLADFNLQTTNGDSITISAPLTGTYPQTLFSYDVSYNQTENLLTLQVVPLQYNQQTKVLTLYHHLDFQIAYLNLLPVGPYLADVNLNQEQPLTINGETIPLTIDVGNQREESLTLVWTIRDTRDYVVASQRVTSQTITGTTTITFNLETAYWQPGLKDLAVYLKRGDTILDSWNQPVLVAGLYLNINKGWQYRYPISTTQLNLVVTVRDEESNLVSGLAQNSPISLIDSNFAFFVDGHPQIGTIHENATGEYHLTIDTQALSGGDHYVALEAIDTRQIVARAGWYIALGNNPVGTLYLPLIKK